MKNIIGKCLFGYGVGFFFGYVVIAVGLGAVCPSLYKVATPVVCGESESLEVIQNRHSWRPGATMWTATVYIVDESTGKKENRTSMVKLVAGAIYGLGIFILLLPRLCRKRTNPVVEPATNSPADTPVATAEAGPAGSIDEKLAKLKQLHEDTLITAEEYEQKKAEVLKDI